MNCHLTDRKNRPERCFSGFAATPCGVVCTFQLSYQSHKSPVRRHLAPISGGGTHFTPFLLFVVTQLSLIRIAATKIAPSGGENAPSGDPGSASGDVAGVVARSTLWSRLIKWGLNQQKVSRGGGGVAVATQQCTGRRR